VPHMKARGYGKIINIGSGTVFRGIPQMMHYVTSKGAVSAFTRSLSRAVGEHGICVNTLVPGFTLSDSVVEDNPTHVKSSRDNAIQRRAIKRDAHPPDLLGALIFLASSDSDFITGQTIAVDGGAVNTAPASVFLLLVRGDIFIMYYLPTQFWFILICPDRFKGRALHGHRHNNRTIDERRSRSQAQYRRDAGGVLR